MMIIMKKNNSLKYGAKSSRGSGLDLATELAQLINLLKYRRKITDQLLIRLRRWENVMKTLLEENTVEIEENKVFIGFRKFEDWAGTSKYYTYAFHYDGKILPDRRDQIGGYTCNYTNTLSRKWYFMDRGQIFYVCSNIDMITKKILMQAIQREFDEKILEKIDKIIEKLS